ncbi:hypothetical protein [Herbaspirillum huttiense]|uniref:hypothetical protein n=1 Tax=Herbaspirillum huttiense TaxID=863372 RepID=UPI002176B032|nr:hypothetical protein [Herbaspirillum huttiense]UWE19386.1 hypothetical protein NY669_26790 [Herbaspirillum huttiense]
MPGEIHQQLVSMGERWLKKQGFSVVASELVAGGANEQADVIGFRSNCSAVVEAKASRADFFADQSKPHRSEGGMGVYRFYLCPEGIIRPEDLPQGWGLLHAVGRKVVDVVKPMGNMWPTYGHAFGEWEKFQHKPDADAERSVLFSIARRRSMTRSDEHYEKKLKDAACEFSRVARRADKLADEVKKLELQLALAVAGGSNDPQNMLVAIRKKIG